MREPSRMLTALIFAGLMAALGTFVAVNPSILNGPPAPPRSGDVVPVVAAENFWGSLASQIGGVHVSVLSLVTDPNADPHEFETNTSAAKAVATAGLVIVNGLGYDAWALQLISASSPSGQLVLNVGALVDRHLGDNPHLWYCPEYVRATARAILQDLETLDPADSGYFQQQFAVLGSSLATTDAQMAQMRDRFGGTDVAATESIFVYLANATGLDLISPTAFMDAVSEGNSPPAASVSLFEDQLRSGEARLLVYNQQTVTPLTEQMKQLAVAQGLPTVAVTETIVPGGATYQEWLGAELAALLLGLEDAAAGG